MPRGGGLERQRILDVAAGLAFARGLRRTCMAELARRPGVVPSALHYHFAGGRDELMAGFGDQRGSPVMPS